ncbi:hypothetical protein [Flavivirga eckloniae]|uniref:Uncharacterized protein n=1 Tax=Flavivirga eckloniae TaxID=1803846 RepID=A0A2K9PRT4_9FLAO|nr:hypothetical protein [Flavivirga eckloniae]AUP79783.1 hypothetical protein C1H87_14145 [Flavivirga eckloniae]
MQDTETKIIPYNVLMSHYITLALLILIFDKSGFSDDLKEHCKTGVKVVGIIYADKAYGTGTKALSGKEYDAFFKLFPPAYFNNRGAIPPDMVIKNLKLSITTDDLIHMSGE